MGFPVTDTHALAGRIAFACLDACCSPAYFTLSSLVDSNTIESNFPFDGAYC
jgi:hypothetical protein